MVICYWPSHYAHNEPISTTVTELGGTFDGCIAQNNFGHKCNAVFQMARWAGQNWLCWLRKQVAHPFRPIIISGDRCIYTRPINLTLTNVPARTKNERSKVEITNDNYWCLYRNILASLFGLDCFVLEGCVQACVQRKDAIHHCNIQECFRRHLQRLRLQFRFHDTSMTLMYSRFEKKNKNKNKVRETDWNWRQS